MANYEELFLKDSKEYVKYIIDYYNNSNGDSFDLLMRFFATDNSKLGGYLGTELENRDFARYVYELLGWNRTIYFDAINSFWTTFSWVMHCYYPLKYKKMPAGNISIYKNKHFDYQTFPERYVANEKDVLNDIVRLLESNDEIKCFASLCHCVANFMPCPDAYEKGKLSYNQLKGVLLDVQDYFPLMIDKIERCYVKQMGIAYTIKDEKTKKEISYDTVVSWHKWFLKNREEYCLEDYYDIKDGHLEYKPLFDKQVLEYPVPQKEDEIKECLEEIIKRIETRAIRMAKKLEQQ